MPDTNFDSVEEAVGAAFQEGEQTEETQEEVQEGEESTEGEETTVEEGAEEDGEEGTKDASPEKPTSAPEYGLEADKLKEAAELYKNLSGENGLKVLKQIAKQAGLQLVEDQEQDKPEPKVKPVGKLDIKQILETKLGARFSFLAGPIAEALQEIDAHQSSRVEQVREDLTAKEFKQEIEKEIKEYSAKNGLSDSLTDPVSAKVFELCSKYKFTGSNRKEFGEYFAEMHDLALAKLGKSKTNGRNISEAKTDKINRNLASDEPEAAGNAGTRTRKVRPKDYSAEDAVAAALRGEEWDKED